MSHEIITPSGAGVGVQPNTDAEDTLLFYIKLSKPEDMSKVTNLAAVQVTFSKDNVRELRRRLDAYLETEGI